jgi:antitoxin (DNA-binding transcriptional repressor) of toxin-antitoxin stability system
MAGAGETVCITHRGRPVARLVLAETPRTRIDVAALRTVTRAIPRQSKPAGGFVRRMRDEDRY